LLTIILILSRIVSHCRSPNSLSQVIPSTVVKDKLETHLEHFTRENQISGKGPLSLVLILTRDVSRREFPLKAKDFVTGKKGQVKG